MKIVAELLLVAMENDPACVALLVALVLVPALAVILRWDGKLPGAGGVMVEVRQNVAVNTGERRASAQPAQGPHSDHALMRQPPAAWSRRVQRAPLARRAAARATIRRRA